MTTDKPRNGSTQPSIAEAINKGTIKEHTELNRLITARLGLALPPSARSPSRYAIGLSYFANIYIAFEQEFDRLAHTIDGKNPTEEWLAHLRPQGLPRSSRLGRDLKHIRSSSRDEYSVKGAERNAQSVADLISECRSKPHLLVAYAWVMYMATFSGGRWIRLQFAKAGPEFWLGKDSDSQADFAEATDLPGFSFLNFDGDLDGEDLKWQFKKNLERADDLLTIKEKQEVVAASRKLFEYCITLIHEIDRDVWWQESASWQIPIGLVGIGLAWMLFRALGGRLYTI